MTDVSVVRFVVLGPLEVQVDGCAVELRGRKPRALLAVLLLRAGEVVSGDSLIDALWGEQPPASAPNSVRVYVSQLRKLLGEGRLVTRSTGYVLHVRPDELDADRFARLVGEGRERRAAGDPASAAQLLGEALALWRGPPLADVAFMQFAQAEIARLEEARLSAVEERVEAELELGRASELIPELEGLVRVHPLRERLRAALMLALYRSGRQADALEFYRQGRQALSEELGLEPGPTLSKLHQAILNQDAALDTSSPRRESRRGAARPVRGSLLIVVGATLLLAGIGATVVELTREGGGGLETLAPSSLGVIDAGSHRIVAQIPVAASPTRLASDRHRVWVGSDDSGTLSAVEPDTRKVSRLIAIGGFPSALAVGARSVWALDGKSGLLVKIDPAYEGVAKRVRVAARNLAYDKSREGLDPVSVAVGLGWVWATDGSRWLIRVNPATMKVDARVDTGSQLDGVAVGADAVWAISGASATAIRIDRRGKVTARIGIVSSPGFESPYPLAVATGGGAVWVLNGNTATVTKIDPDQRTVTATIPIGIDRGPLRLAFGAGALWVANDDGTLARIDETMNTVEIIPVAHRLKDVAVDDGAVWVTAGGGLTATEAPSDRSAIGSLRALPTSSCSPIYYQGGGRPRYLIASDAPLQGPGRTLYAQVGQAIQFILKQHRFRAGRYAVGYQSCDDSTIQLGYPSNARCAANAHAYARDTTVIGVIGPLNSPCSQVEIPILNRAPGAPLAMISPANTYVGLTHRGPDTASDEPGRYYPTGQRNYVRTAAADDYQGAADAILARRLGVRRVYVLNDGFSYGNGIAADFRSAAVKLGIKIAGSETYPTAKNPSFAALVRRARAAKADAVFLGLFGAYPDTGRLIRDLRAGLGVRAKIIAPDSFAVDFHHTVEVTGSAAEGMTISAVGIPNERLARPGKAFVAAFGKTVGQTPTQTSVAAAQATDVLLDAIAASDGTRASVTKQLLKTHISNGILGSFSFDQNGDTTAAAVTIYRITNGIPHILAVITPPPNLVH